MSNRVKMNIMQFSSVKKLFSLIVVLVFYGIFDIRTCHGEGIPLLHSVFVSNIVNPNDHEIAELTNLLAFPIIFDDLRKWSLMSHMGLVVNHSIIFSSNPNYVTTFPALDLEKHPIGFYLDLAITSSTNTTTGASLKGLRKALEISTTPSIIFLAINTKPEDTGVLNQILHSMETKLNLVILLRIDKQTSISDRIALNFKNFEEPAVEMILNQVNENSAEEYHLIAKASESVLYTLVAKIYPEMSKPMDMDEDFTEKNIVFVYDVINPTQDVLNQTSNSMEAHLRTSINTSNQYSIIFSSHRDTINVTELPENYTAKGFQEMIKSRVSATSKSQSSLEILVGALQTIPPFSQIIYYVNSEPSRDEDGILPEIVQLVMDKGIEISIYGYGKLSGYALPLVYRTIQDTYNFTRFPLEHRISESSSRFLPEEDDE